MPPGESDWSPVDFTLIRVADTGPHEPALAFGCQRINKDRPGFAGEIERRASIPVGSSIPCVDMRVANVTEEFDESAARLLRISLTIQARCADIANLQNPKLIVSGQTFRSEERRLGKEW